MFLAESRDCPRATTDRRLSLAQTPCEVRAAPADPNRLAEAQLTATDPDERREIVADLRREIAEDLPVLSLYVPTRRLFYDEATFDGWYYTPGCSPCRGSRNKHMFVTAQETALPEQASS